MAAMTTRRKLAIATWDAPREGNIYGKLTVEATQLLDYVEWARRATGERVTVTHVVGRAVAAALRATPQLNGVIRFGAFVPRDRVDIAFLVSLAEGADLAKAKIADCDRKSVGAIARELRELAERLHGGRDEAFNKSKPLLRVLPTFLIRPLLKVTGFLSSVLGLDLPPLGLEAWPFGSAIVTNVGVFGVDEGFVPPTPFAQVPLYVLIGAVHDAAVVRDGAVVVRKMMTLTATIDHRFVDGAQGGALARTVREILENPWLLEGMEGPPRLLEDRPRLEITAATLPDPVHLVDPESSG